MSKEEKPLYTSATQYDTFELCPRKWFFLKILRLPEMKKFATTFGTVLHQVAERYFLADDYGRDRKTGEEVDLYPEGWLVALGFDGKPEGEIKPHEGEVIKDMVARAIEQGYWKREPGREVEKKFRKHILDGQVIICGMVDVWYPGRILDHKTTKNAKYAKSGGPNGSLIKALPMLLYFACTQDVTEGMIEHVTFSKDVNDPFIKNPKADLYDTHINDLWTRVIDLSREMLELRKQTDWEQVPGPQHGTDACKAFGGCPFQAICQKRQSVERYKANFDSAYKPQLLEKPAQKKDGSMNLKKLMKNKNKAAAPAAEKAEEAPAAVAEQQPTPWADPECSACGGSGLNSKGAPCRICDANAVNNITSADCELVDGVWTKVKETPVQEEANFEKPDFDGDEEGQAEEQAEDKTPAEEPAKASKPTSAAKKLGTKKRIRRTKAQIAAGVSKEEAAAMAEKGEQPEAKSASVSETAKEEEPNEVPTVTPGAPVTRYPRVLIGCASTGGKSTIEAGSVLWSTYQDMMDMEEETGNAIDWALSKDVWQRRDALKTSKVVERVLESYKGWDIIFDKNATGDLQALQEALIPHASEVIRGL